MTHHVIFNASQIFLSFVKKSLESDTWTLESGVLCTISCASAIEAIVNELLQEDAKIIGWDELKIKSKIENIANANNQKIDWGSSHWQNADRIIKVRNYLVHFKGENLGLFGTPHIEEMLTNFVLVKQESKNADSTKQSEKYNFSKNTITKYYTSTLLALRELDNAVKTNDSKMRDFLNSEAYEFFTIL
ncbi:hypothetical protein [Chamaesiphon polymorphus]|uniref:Uncharacterized protein n=1 Tax=Chamaesiphon polymorphus CCALA 037 TaxID=2107692 RepID=A0A2T1G9X5_9CYAN|nr:hypothetical protein [Chamaesiphon polymorphus]PSB53956.1 hypothetical protein C7B77_19150 [Chamaesiphon polymorphus CCALA 037]